MSNVRSLVLAKKTHAAPSAYEGSVLHEDHATRGSLSMPAGECQSVEGAPRRRAAPGNQFVRVAAGAATGRQTKCCASAGIATTPPGRAKFAPVKRQCASDRHLREVRSEPRPCAQAQRLRTSRATTGVGASAHARHASATSCYASRTPAPVASEHNGRSRKKYGVLFQPGT